MMERPLDPSVALHKLKAEFERVQWEYRELTRRLDRALYEDQVSYERFAELSMKRARLLNRMKELQIRMGAIGYG